MRALGTLSLLLLCAHSSALGLLFVHPPALSEAAKEAAVKDYVERNRHYRQVWDIVNLYDTVLEEPWRRSG